MTTTVTKQIRFAIKGRHKRAVCTPRRDPALALINQPTESKPATQDNEGRVPRVSKLMALAIRFDGLLKDGVVASQSELAELAQVSQPRMTQIMNLLHLAPEIQEEILFLKPVMTGRDPIKERYLRTLTRENIWETQFIQWLNLMKQISDASGASKSNDHVDRDMSGLSYYM